MRLVVGLRPVSDTLDKPDLALGRVAETGLRPTHVSGLKLRQLLSLSDVPQPLSPAAQAAQPRLARP